MDKTCSSFVAATNANPPGHFRRVSTAFGAIVLAGTSAWPCRQVTAMVSELPPGTNFLLKTLLAFGAGLLIAGLL